MIYENYDRIKQSPTLSDFFEFIYTVLFCLVIFTGYGPIFHFTSIYMSIIAALQIVFAFSLKSAASFQHRSKSITFYYIFIILGYLIYNYYHSYSRSASLSYLLRFFVYGLFLFVALTAKLQEKILSIASKYSVVIAIIYIICFPFFGADSGILGSYQATGISMSIALGLFVARFFVNGKMTKWDVLACLLLVMALMITGKRTLFAIPVAMAFLTFVLSCDKKKYRKLFLAILLILLIAPVLITLVPAMSNVYMRIVNGLSDQTLTYRIYFWQYATMLWNQNPITGIGFGTFPVHIADHSSLVDNYFHTINAYDTHNIYFQMLAEIGTVGLVIFCTFFLICLVYTLRCILKYQRNTDSTYVYLMYVSLYLQCWFLLYGITGNPLYMADECYLYFFAVSNIYSINQQIAKLQQQRIQAENPYLEGQQHEHRQSLIRNVKDAQL